MASFLRLSTPFGGLLRRTPLARSNVLSKAVTSRSISWYNNNRRSGCSYQTGSESVFKLGSCQVPFARQLSTESIALASTAERHFIADLEQAVVENNFAKESVYEATNVLGGVQQSNYNSGDTAASSTVLAAEDQPMKMNFGLANATVGLNYAVNTCVHTWTYVGTIILISEMLLLLSFAFPLMCDAASHCDHADGAAAYSGSGYVGSDCLCNRLSVMASILLALSTFTYGACLTLNPVGYTELSVMFLLFTIFYTADVQHELLEFTRSQSFTGCLIFLHMTHIYASVLLTFFCLFSM